MNRLYKRDFLKEIDFQPEDLLWLLDLAEQLKKARKEGREKKYLDGKNIALLFEKDSTRTRCSFEVGAHEQGAHVTYLGPSGSQVGKKESMADTARVLSGFLTPSNTGASNRQELRPLPNMHLFPSGMA